VTVEPKLAVPDKMGSEVTVGVWLVGKVATDQMFVVPDALILVVRTVKKLPASAAT
jgi:hypothetical protein